MNFRKNSEREVVNINFRTCVLLKIILATTMLGIPVYGSGNSYFIDVQNGSDTNSGLSPDSAWQSLNNVNRTTFQPGDSILFKAEGIWNGRLWAKGSGEIGKPIVIDTYGTGTKPVINGQGKLFTVRLYNQQYWEINNLEITNYDGTDPSSYKRGVWIEASDAGAVSHIHLKNLVIHDVNGNLDPGNNSKHNGGIFFEVTGSSVPTSFNNILIENCHIYDVDRTGISLNSSWSTRTIDNNMEWTPSHNVIIRNNVIERTGGNGLIWRVSHRPLVEYNIFHECATKLSGNAMFFFNCDSALAQFNEAYLTVYNPGDTDAGAFDADYRCKNTIYQYNYSHDNGEAAFIAPSNGTSATAFQDGAVFRYNISQNDRREVFHVSGPITNTTFYNNTIYIGPHLSDILIIYHKSWGGYPDKTSYYNNIIYNFGSNCRYSFGSSTKNKFDYNLFFGNNPSSEPYDAHKLTSDPKFIDPGSAGIGIETVGGYKLSPDSPCIDSGKSIANNGGRDYWGQIVPFNSATDRGAYEYHTASGIDMPTSEEKLPDSFRILPNYPNPFHRNTLIRFELDEPARVEISIFNIRGRLVATLSDQVFRAGNYSLMWNAMDLGGNKLPSGIYLYKFQTGNTSKIMKMSLVR